MSTTHPSAPGTIVPNEEGTAPSRGLLKGRIPNVTALLTIPLFHELPITNAAILVGGGDLNARVVEAEEQERNRSSRQPHNELAQTLARVLVRLRVATLDPKIEQALSLERYLDQIRITLRRDANVLPGVLVDEGTGFDPTADLEHTPRDEALDRILERAAIVRDQVTVESALDRGTCMGIELPLRGVEALPRAGSPLLAGERREKVPS